MNNIHLIFRMISLWLLTASFAVNATSQETSLPSGLQQAWQQARHQLEVTADGYRATNPGNQQQIQFTAEGIQVTSLSRSAAWQWSLSLTGYGTPEQLAPVPAVTARRVAGQRIEYQRGALTEWYENKVIGLEQGFTLQQPPQSDAQTIVLAFQLGGDLTPRWQTPGQALRFDDSATGYALTYRDLKVIDAKGNELPAQLTLNQEQLAIQVDVAQAAWPVVVDPLVVNEQKVTAQTSDAAADDKFGYAVAFDNDTALIGAIGDNDNGSESGSAYIFTHSDSSWSFQQKLTADDGAERDSFGVAVALDGDTALIGADKDDDNSEDSGSVYVFIRSGSTWSQQAKLLADDGAIDDQFGSAVALDGDTALIGAYRNDSTYVFIRSGGIWTQQTKLTDLDGNDGDSFGKSVALSGDTALIGAYLDNDNGTDSGAAYVFTRSGSVWTQQQKLTAADTGLEDSFGASVALLGDIALIGAIGDNDNGTDSGSAYVFTRSGSTWSQQQKLTASDGAVSDYFGISVALDGDIALVGALFNDTSGSAYVFTRSGSTWSQQQKLIASDRADYDLFGIPVALDGDTALIGASGDDSFSGSAYVFTINDYAQWGQQAKLTAVADDGADYDLFGVAVALDGDTALIGAYADDTYTGSAYVFTRSGSTWHQQQKLLADDGADYDAFGWSVAVDGDTALIGALYDDDNGSDSGSAYVFTRSGSSWTQQQKLTASDGAADDNFGYSVALSGDTALIGALYDDDNGSDSGSAYVFSRSGSSWSQQAKLTASDGAADDNFGFAVALDSSTALISAPLGASTYGSAYVFTRSGVIWGEQAKLTASDGAAEDYFGVSVALDGNTALIGAIGDDDDGSAYVFTRSGSVWSEQQKLTAFDGAADDQFGRSVAVDGDTALVGANGDDDNGSDSGSAYVFTRSGSTWSQQQKLTASDGAASDYFGYVALSGDTALIGASYDDSYQGSAYFYTFPCGFNYELTADRWTMIASPCSPDLPGTVSSVFGDALATGNYGSRWVLYQRDASADSYVALGLDDSIDPGVGYWLKTLDAATLEIAGSATPILGAVGCASTNGCYAISLTAPPSSGDPRNNLIGHPLPYAVNWSDARIVIDGTTAYTLTDAESNGYVKKWYYIWNGNSYDSYDDATPGMEGVLNSFDGIWLQVLEGSDGHDVEILIPAELGDTTSQQMEQSKSPWYLAWLDWLIPTAQAETGLAKKEWYVRLIVEDPDQGLLDRNNVLGQLQDSRNDYDAHDLPEVPPFGSPYLTIVFPHPEWGEQAGDYASDYRSIRLRKRQRIWSFEIRGDTLDSEVLLFWQGDAAILDDYLLIDEDLNLNYSANDPIYQDEGLPVLLFDTVRHFRWVYDPRRRR